MKITEKDLLQSIGNADEKLIEQAAPQQWETDAENGAHLPRMRRRIPELIAVCAAFCVCLCGILLIHRLHSADLRTFSSPEEQAAYTALVNYLEGGMHHDREKILQYSLTEVFAVLLTETEEEAEKEIELQLESIGQLNGYQIGECRDTTEDIRHTEQTERDFISLYYYYYLDKGNAEKAEEWRTEHSQFLSFYTKCDRAYTFDVTLDWAAPDKDMELTVTLYNGEWRVWSMDSLYPAMTQEAKEKLEAFREKYGPVEIPVE